MRSDPLENLVKIMDTPSLERLGVYIYIYSQDFSDSFNEIHRLFALRLLQRMTI